MRTRPEAACVHGAVLTVDARRGTTITTAKEPRNFENVVAMCNPYFFFGGGEVVSTVGTE